MGNFKELGDLLDSKIGSVLSESEHIINVDIEDKSEDSIIKVTVTANDFIPKDYDNVSRVSDATSYAGKLLFLVQSVFIKLEVLQLTKDDYQTLQFSVVIGGLTLQGKYSI